MPARLLVIITLNKGLYTMVLYTTPCTLWSESI